MEWALVGIGVSAWMLPWAVAQRRGSRHRDYILVAQAWTLFCALALGAEMLIFWGLNLYYSSVAGVAVLHISFFPLMGWAIASKAGAPAEHRGARVGARIVVGCAWAWGALIAFAMTIEALVG